MRRWYQKCFIPEIEIKQSPIKLKTKSKCKGVQSEVFSVFQNNSSSVKKFLQYTSIESIRYSEHSRQGSLALMGLDLIIGHQLLVLWRRRLLPTTVYLKLNKFTYIKPKAGINHIKTVKSLMSKLSKGF